MRNEMVSDQSSLAHPSQEIVNISKQVLQRPKVGPFGGHFWPLEKFGVSWRLRFWVLRYLKVSQGDFGGNFHDLEFK